MFASLFFHSWRNASACTATRLKQWQSPVISLPATAVGPLMSDQWSQDSCNTWCFVAVASLLLPLFSRKNTCNNLWEETLVCSSWLGRINQYCAWAIFLARKREPGAAILWRAAVLFNIREGQGEESRHLSSLGPGFEGDSPKNLSVPFSVRTHRVRYMTAFSTRHLLDLHWRMSPKALSHLVSLLYSASWTLRSITFISQFFFTQMWSMYIGHLHQTSLSLNRGATNSGDLSLRCYLGCHQVFSPPPQKKKKVMLRRLLLACG